MTVNRKPTGTATTIPGGLSAGAMTATAATLGGAFITAILIDREILTWNHTGYAVMCILLLASWLAAVVSSERVKRQRLMICMISGLLYFILLLLSTALFFGGQYHGVGETGLLIFCGSMLGVFTGYAGKKGRNGKKIRRPNR